MQGSCPRRRSSRQTSMPSIPGITQSSTASSGAFSALRTASASRPSSTTSGVKPRRCSVTSRTRRETALSSARRSLRVHHPRGFESAGGPVAARAPAPPANRAQRFLGRRPRHGRLDRRPGDAERAPAAPGRCGDRATPSSTSVVPRRPRLPLALLAVRGSGFEQRPTPQPSRSLRWEFRPTHSS